MGVGGAVTVVGGLEWKSRCVDGGDDEDGGGGVLVWSLLAHGDALPVSRVALPLPPRGGRCCCGPELSEGVAGSPFEHATLQ